MKKPTVPFSIYNTLFLFLTFILLSVGTVFVLEASVAESFSTFGDQYFLFRQHTIGLIVGFIGFFAGLFVPARIWVKFGTALYIIGLIFLIAVFIPGIGRELNGASRWINIGGFRLQSVEFFKFGLVAFYANWLARHQRMRVFLFTLGIPAILLILQPDLGSLLLVISIAVSTFFVAGGNFKQLLLMAALGVPLVIMAIVSSPYRRDRLTTFLNPDSDPLGASFHIRQITLALGRGGWFGQGLGNSSQKYAYIPEASTDSIFAIIAEELGYLGSTVIIIALLTYILVAYQVINRSQPETSVRYLGLGLVSWIGFQTLLNLCSVVGLVPLTGVPLPFFSYGRSALIMLLFAAGIILQIGRTPKKS
jgi:cell division protein FtsW